jgi:hypothetical protein
MGTLSGLQEYQVYVYNCEKFNKSAEKAPLLEWQDLIDATVVEPKQNDVTKLKNQILIMNYRPCLNFYEYPH